MNITILQGDNYLAIQKRLEQFSRNAKKKQWVIKRLDGKKNLDLKLEIRSQFLFDNHKLLIINGLKDLPNEQYNWLKANIKKYPTDLIFVFDGFIPKSSLKNFSSLGKVESYELPTNVFKFLDSFYPGNSKSCLRLLRSAENVLPLEFIFSLLGRHVRDLYWVSEDSSKIPYPSWRVAKLEKQSQSFEKHQLKKIINYLSTSDNKIKKSEQDLASALDLVIIQYLE